MPRGSGGSDKVRITGDVYYSATAASIGANTTTEISPPTGVSYGQEFVLANDGAVDISYQLNSTGDDSFTVKAGESFSDDFFRFSKIYITNGTGTACAYRLRING